MDENIIMSTKEVKKYDIIKKVISKELNGSEAAELLDLTVRHIRRLKNKVDKVGIKGLIHGNRGKPGNRRMPEEEKDKIADLIKQKYPDFGPTLATEKLFELDKIERSPSAVRVLMIKEEIWKPKQKKKEERRQWRQRKAAKGEMTQYDGSYENWLEDRAPKCCLLAAIDDADSEVWAQFDEHEGVEPTFNFWRGYVETFGKPNSIYVDKFSTYSMNHKLAKENPDTLTQFERAMEKDLGIAVIKANSPQAKGRVERLFETLQDRLIKELRLKNISTVAEANKFLREEFLPKFNARFMVEARSSANLHKKLNEREKKKLDSIFSRQSERAVCNDFTISHKKVRYQLDKVQPVTVCKQDKVIIEERMDHSVHIRLRGKYLNCKLLPELPERQNSGKNASPWAIPKSTTDTPAISPYWRKIAQVEYLKKLTKVSR